LIDRHTIVLIALEVIGIGIYVAVAMATGDWLWISRP
jgi:hypothetical protein